MIEWPRPKSVKSLWEFIDLTVYYRKFIKNYSAIAAPLTQLLSFVWTNEVEKTFYDLKKVVS